MYHPLGTWSATQGCALNGNRTYRSTLNLLSHNSQGVSMEFFNPLLLLFSPGSSTTLWAVKIFIRTTEKLNHYSERFPKKLLSQLQGRTSILWYLKQTKLLPHSLTLSAVAFCSETCTHQTFLYPLGLSSTAPPPLTDAVSFRLSFLHAPTVTHTSSLWPHACPLSLNQTLSFRADIMSFKGDQDMPPQNMLLWL